MEGALTHKFGGIPAWGIGVGLAAAFVGYNWYSHRGDTTNPNDSPSATDPSMVLDPSQGDNTNYGLPPGAIGDFLSQDPTNAAYPVGSTPQGLPGPVTNVQWSRLAFDQLLSKGDDPTLVSNALSKFLSGQTLTAAEQSVVNLAQQMFGAPPEGILPVLIGGIPTPTPDPQPTPAPVPPPAVLPPSSTPAPIPAAAGPAPFGQGSRVYVVVPGDTLIGITGKLHGSDWHALYARNAAHIEEKARQHGKKSSDNGHWIYPGTWLYY
jgi:nucleoid-associated protein YgaU